MCWVPTCFTVIPLKSLWQLDSVCVLGSYLFHSDSHCSHCDSLTLYVCWVPTYFTVIPTEVTVTVGLCVCVGFQHVSQWFPLKSLWQFGFVCVLGSYMFHSDSHWSHCDSVILYVCWVHPRWSHWSHRGRLALYVCWIIHVSQRTSRKSLSNRFLQLVFTHFQCLIVLSFLAFRRKVLNYIEKIIKKKKTFPQLSCCIFCTIYDLDNLLFYVYSFRSFKAQNEILGCLSIICLSQLLKNVFVDQQINHPETRGRVSIKARYLWPS